MLYIGVHKGTFDDGYICSSKIMKKEYKVRPNDFIREIIAEGDYPLMQLFEETLLKTVDAANDDQFYNLHNGNGKFYLKGHTDEAKQKMKANHTKSWTGREHTDETKSKMSKSMKGKKHKPYYGRPVSEETRQKMRDAMKKSKWHIENTKEKIND